jgi:hypothetical protein
MVRYMQFVYIICSLYISYAYDTIFTVSFIEKQFHQFIENHIYSLPP